MIIFMRTGAFSGHENIKNVIVSLLFELFRDRAKNLGSSESTY
jgi:hypothetical protein